MSKNIKAKAKTQKVVETVASKPEVVVRGHKYDGKTLDLDSQTDIVKCERMPTAPRTENGRPSVPYRLWHLVHANPGKTVGEIIKLTIDKSAEFAPTPSPYTKKSVLEPLWVMGYIRGMVSKGYLSMSK